MTYCEQCGSTSFDEQGFCRGCGARPPGLATAGPHSAPGANPSAISPQGVVQSVGSIPLAQAQVKSVWRAVVLAFLLGPLGMIYSTALGAVVMAVVSVLAMLFLNNVIAWLLVPAICAVWAGLAARSANSIY